jgi:uncharacterized membrane protein
MPVYLIIAIIAIFISLFLFYTYSSQNRLRSEKNREELNRRRQELLDRLIKSKDNKQDKLTEENEKNDNKDPT